MPGMISRRGFLGLAAALAVPTACASRRPELTAAEQDLGARLMAPCRCPQTLDVHASGPATEMRAEIHQRLVRGEDPEKIYEDIVARHGDWIRAGGGPLLPYVGPFVGLVGFLALGGVVFAARRWVRRGKTVAAAAPAAKATDDEWNARLDDELDDVD
jgi:cytochrome c-type biogenesis protein CcmH/NrfF